MTKEELYLKTIFCCIACNGDVATEEVDMALKICAQKTTSSTMLIRGSTSTQGLLKSMSKVECSCKLILKN